MKRTIKTIGTIGAMTILLCGAYLLGTTQADTVTVTKEIIKEVEAVPAGYIDTFCDDFHDNYVDMRQVTDFVVNDGNLHLYFEDGSGFYWKR